ncbi:flagellar hook capping FlgD N-terminal domain-containing protein [Clostridium sulfidigenes]|uniref:flagellar hook capping FlgD N-terminal domain-containing protein n=1 Tax=Clostridium sulfidigenes TaxID=318464 RepID=UPI000A03BEAB|nr:flagellar hook capping FlgD N-terminal domain-containing protein [Clostridium sulfidigenes]
MAISTHNTATTPTNNTATTSWIEGNKTKNGTPIVKPGSELDKNSFFKILAAELSNQDPTQSQDTTAYISQLAQFTTLEQMSSLNSTMTLSSAQGLTGKFVALDALDANGVPQCGVVRAVYKHRGDVYVTVEGVDGKYTDYEYSQVTDVIDSGDPNMDNLTFSNAVTLMGKIVEIALPLEPPVEKPDGDGKEEEKPVEPKSITGKVLEVYRDAEGIKLKVEVEVDGKVEVRDYLFDSVIGVKG